MTDTYPGLFSGYPDEPAPHRRHWLQLARIFLAVAGIALVFFLLQWTTAVRVAPEDLLAANHAGGIYGTEFQWRLGAKTGAAMPESRVVVPQYAGGGRGSTLIGFNAWRFGTVREHPVWFGACIALLVAVAGGFAVCTWYALHPREEASTTEVSPRTTTPPE